MSKAYPKPFPVTRVLVTALSLALYALLVWTRTRQFVEHSDLDGRVTWHALQFLGIFVVAILCGIAVGPRAQSMAQVALAGLQPNNPDEDIDRTLKTVARIVIAMGMMYPFLWIAPSLNRFLDVHLPLLVEADTLLYVMGIVTGVGWFILYEQRAWLGLLASPALSLLVISNALVTHSWP